MSADGRAMLDLARSLAVVGHAGQSRKGTGEPYFNHVERVADTVQGWRRKTIAYLHDLVEDTPITPMTLHVIGFPPDIVSAVLRLSRRADQTYREFIHAIAQSPDPDVRPVKLADVRDNLKDLDNIPGNTDSKRCQYLSAELVLLRSEES